MIEVEYDGEYPNACRGTLLIKENGIIVYNKMYCCRSTGGVWFDNNWNAHVEQGELLWEDTDKFSEEIQKAVEEKLSTISVCCGGCV